MGTAERAPIARTCRSPTALGEARGQILAEVTAAKRFSQSRVAASWVHWGTVPKEEWRRPKREAHAPHVGLESLGASSLERNCGAFGQ
jgi:hypothetical protein